MSLPTNDKFILDEEKNVIPATLDGWAEFFDDQKNRVVKQEWVRDFFVSTVFIGLPSCGWDHIKPKGLPDVFETMVFHKSNRERFKTSCSWSEALKDHSDVVSCITQNRNGLLETKNG